MEDTLRDLAQVALRVIKLSLNPCSNGRYSQSAGIDYLKVVRTPMEDTLRERQSTTLILLR